MLWLTKAYNDVTRAGMEWGQTTYLKARRSNLASTVQLFLKPGMSRGWITDVCTRMCLGVCVRACRCVCVWEGPLAHHCLWLCLGSSSRAGALPGDNVLLTPN